MPGTRQISRETGRTAVWVRNLEKNLFRNGRFCNPTLTAYRDRADESARNPTRRRAVFARSPVSLVQTFALAISIDSNRIFLNGDKRRSGRDWDGELRAYRDIVSYDVSSCPSRRGAMTYTESLALFIRLAVIIDSFLFPRKLRSSLARPNRYVNHRSCKQWQIAKTYLN